jgi:hypothetical protein
MAVHLYEDNALTQQVSEGDLSNPDDDIYNGTDGESKDKELFLKSPERRTRFCRRNRWPITAQPERPTIRRTFS